MSKNGAGTESPPQVSVVGSDGDAESEHEEASVRRGRGRGRARAARSRAGSATGSVAGTPGTNIIPNRQPSQPSQQQEQPQQRSRSRSRGAASIVSLLKSGACDDKRKCGINLKCGACGASAKE